MLDRYHFTNCDVILLDGFRENAGFTDGQMTGGRTTDACETTVALLCSSAICRAKKQNLRQYYFHEHTKITIQVRFENKLRGHL